MDRYAPYPVVYTHEDIQILMKVFPGAFSTRYWSMPWINGKPNYFGGVLYEKDLHRIHILSQRKDARIMMELTNEQTD